jgi:hypothetical protein
MRAEISSTWSPSWNISSLASSSSLSKSEHYDMRAKLFPSLSRGGSLLLLLLLISPLSHYSPYSLSRSPVLSYLSLSSVPSYSRETVRKMCWDDTERSLTSPDSQAEVEIIMVLCLDIQVRTKIFMKSVFGAGTDREMGQTDRGPGYPGISSGTRVITGVTWPGLPGIWWTGNKQEILFSVPVRKLVHKIQARQARDW